MDLDAYVTEHRAEWRRLAYLSGRRKLTAEQADELVLLYQRVATQLSVVRSRTPDPALVAELSRLVLTARSALTGPSRADWGRIPRFFGHDLPLVFYLSRWWWVACGLSFVLVSGIVMGWVIGDPEVARNFGLSEATAEDLADGAFAGYYSEFLPQNFGLRVWTNNSYLAAMCLASGILVFPPLLLLWNEALRFGAIGGVMVNEGAGSTFFGLVTPHGLLELTAIFVSAGLGMRVGWAWIDPGPVRTRAQALAHAAKQGVRGALGLVAVLGVAAVVEAFVTPAPLPIMMRDAIGVVVWVAFLAYVWVLGGAAANQGAAASELAGSLQSQIGVGDVAGKQVSGAVQHGYAMPGQR